ncbi:hypothetical protein [Tenacibaculum sp. 190524A05c]|uniref:hypothetical protein n=1 Tax=Tenacibaculum platacis TaxID=3137852 RepID=UPI0032B28D0E
MRENKISRRELYNLVWSKPLVQLAKEYSYSDNGLRKICIKHNIPFPKSGYWSKIKFNKKVEVTPLPKGDDDIIIELKIRKEGEKEIHLGLSEFQILKRQVENDKSIKHTVPEKITKFDPLIISARKDLKNKKIREWGNSKGLIVSSNGILNIEVSKKNISRSLRIMDTLIKAFKKKGFEIKFDRGTCVVINEEPIKIRLRESLKRIRVNDNGWDRFDLEPSGVLTFKLEDIYPERQWKDSDKNPLETKISSIIATIELRAKEEKKKRIEREEWRKQYEIKKKQEEDFKIKRNQEIDEFKNLFSLADRHQKNLYIRNYIDKFERLEKENNTFDEEKKQWIEWARSKGDWYDPFIEKEDVLLKGIDRDGLV